jgi:hypothetical protein
MSETLTHSAPLCREVSSVAVRPGGRLVFHSDGAPILVWLRDSHGQRSLVPVSGPTECGKVALRKHLPTCAAVSRWTSPRFETRCRLKDAYRWKPTEFGVQYEWRSNRRRHQTDLGMILVR